MHHANLLIGSESWGLSQIPEADRVLGPDVLLYSYERMSIANVRALIYEAGLRPVARPYRVFIIATRSLLHEAQNALLKIFEEPNEHTVFYLIIPREDILLPTLRSRLNYIGREDTGVPGKNGKIFDAFVALPYIERLQLIGEKLTAEDTEWQSEFLHGLETYAAESRDPILIKDTLTLVSYFNINGSSKKMLLEHIALMLPQD